MGEQLPAGYSEIKSGSWRAVVIDSLHDDVSAALKQGTLYDFARAYPGAQSHKGRGAAYSFEAPISGQHVIVRRSRHGGLLAPITGELFAGDGRAPSELRAALRLRHAGIRTPEVLGYVVYPSTSFFSRIDVVLRFVPNSLDLVAALSSESSEFRSEAMRAAASLVTQLSDARIVHPDLNMRNILIEPTSPRPVAWLLDVDRVLFDRSSNQDALHANLRRFARSLEKLRKQGLITLSGGESSQMFIATRATRASR